LDWSGTQFLLVYVPFLVILFIVARLWQRALNQPSSEPSSTELMLDPYLVAVLDHRTVAVNAALAALVHAGALRFEDGALTVVGEAPANASPFERSVRSAVAREVDGVGDIEEAVDEQLDAMETGERGEHAAEVLAAVPQGPLLLLEALVARMGPVPTLLEWDDRFPSPEELTAELEGIRAALARGVASWEAREA
jgi:hypothetical protein